MHKNAIDGQLSAKFSARVSPIGPDGTDADKVAAKLEKFKIEQRKKLEDEAGDD